MAANTASPPLINMQHITKVYGSGDAAYTALTDASVSITAGEFVAIMGPSGSGKSTLMHIMGGLDTPTSGEYILHGTPVTTYSDDQLAEIRNKEIGFVFQAFNLLPRTSVIKNVERPLLYGPKLTAEQRRTQALAMLRLVNLEEKADNLSNHLSGGQIQRVAIARALVMNPSLILADEPTGNLDTKTSQEILELFLSLNKQGHTIVLITHSQEIADYAGRTVYIKDGTIDLSKKARKHKARKRSKK